MIGSVAMAVGLSVLLYGSGLFVLWAPLPWVYLGALRGWRPAIVGMGIALAGVGFFYHQLVPVWLESPPPFLSWFTLPGLGLQGYFSVAVIELFGPLYFSYYLLIALCLYGTHRVPFSIERTFAVIVGLPLGSIALLVAFLVVAFNFPLLTELKGYFLFVLDKIIALGGSAGLKSSELLFVKAQRETIAIHLLQILPAGLVVATLFTAWANLVLLRWWFPRFALLKHLGNLSRWRPIDTWIWVALGTGAVYFLDYYLLQTEWLRVVAANGLLVLAAVYFFHGLAILSFLLQKRPSPFLRLLAYGLLLLFFQIVSLFLIALGVFDIWLDFRKLNKVARKEPH